jgi:hypothetical protein
MGRCAFTDAFLYSFFAPFLMLSNQSTLRAVIKQQFFTWVISGWSGWYGPKPLRTVSTIRM